MKKFLSSIILIAVVLTSCNKGAEDKNDIYHPVIPVAQPISDSAPLCGSIKGTMLTGKTYTIGCEVTINAGDTLTIQPGVRINVTNSAALVVKGSLFSLGTQQQPIWFTVAGVTKTDAPTVGYQAAKDSAFSGKWKGILGDVTANYMIFKWTHIEYAGATLNSAGSTVFTQLGLTGTDPSYAIFFSNPNGYLVFEDSWIYGAVDDAIRVAGGKIALLRNTFEKCGKTGGDVLNIKSGGTGDMAYNFFIGNATNSLKASNKGGVAPQCNIRMYNNTIVNGGYRQAKTGRGGSINFEEGAKGMAYNNLIVNCKYGLRVVNNPVADTANLKYGNNYYWADSVSVASQIYPTTYLTRPQATDYPVPASYLPATYTLGASYNAETIVQKSNPMFGNYTLPITGGYRLQDITAIGPFRFALQAGSPCMGKGFAGFTPLMVVPADDKYGVSNYSQPGTDIGCYQLSGQGNQHL